MRRLFLLALIAVLVLPAGATKRVTVEQLEQTLAADISVHRDDAELARQLNDIELSKRLTAATLARFTAKLPLGPKAALALQLLADRSAFLDPPVDELPATEPPDTATQQRIMDAARGYVVQTTPHLIDFFAMRTTYRFDDSPQVLDKGDWPVRAGLHMVGWSSQEVTLRDGKESRQAAQKTKAKPTVVPQEEQEKGLSSWGEFGPALAVVLTDTAKGAVSWSHWEMTPAGLAAVFHYSVPKSASHYAVSYCCVLGDPSTLNTRPLGEGGELKLQFSGDHAFNETPGYRGSLAVDPATGAILRISIEAELKGDSPLTQAATVVEYGPVQLGDRSFICPLRALAFSVEEPQGHPISASASYHTNAPKMLLNETLFSDYHRLATTARIVPSETPAGLQDRGVPPPSPAAASDSPSFAAVAESQPQPAPVAAQPAPPPAVPPGPVIPEVSLSAATGVPDEPAGAPLSPDAGITLKLTSRLVDVGLMAYDKKGHPVKDLKQSDLEVYDNGRKQEIRFFSQFSTDAQTAPAAPKGVESVFSNRKADAKIGTLATPAPETSATILLIDESHIGWNDLSNARQQILKFLAGLPPGERVGLYAMTGMGFHVLTEITTDHAVLIARLQKWMPTAQSVSQAQQEEVRNRQQFDYVRNPSDLLSVNGNTVDQKSQDNSVDVQLRDFGANPARDALIVLRGVARRLAAVPGHKNLVWVSSDNVFADWTNQAVDTEKGTKGLDSFALRAQEAMNEAHAAVFPFDVSQLEGGAVTAEMQNRGVELAPGAQDLKRLTPEQQEALARGKNSGHTTAQMQQDTHAIQQPIQQVAEATGGRAIRRSGDLATALAGIVDDGHATYQLSFSPQGPADDKYHTITVKLVDKRGLTLRYRTGYLYAKEPATLKDRFREAIWRPAEMNEVAVSADVDAQASGATVKINIAAGDLGLKEQDGRWMDNLDIFFIQRDDAGLHAQLDGQTLGLQLKSSTYQSLLAEGVPFDHFVELRPGMDSLRVLVVDRNSGRMGSVTVPASAMNSGK